MSTAAITEVRSAITSTTVTFINGEIGATVANVAAVGEELGYKVAYFDLAVTAFEAIESVQNFRTDTFTVERVLPDSIKDADMIVFMNVDSALDEAFSIFNEFSMVGYWDGVDAVNLKKIVGIVDGYSSVSDVDARIYNLYPSLVGFGDTRVGR